MLHWHAMDRKDNEALRRLAVVLLTLASIAENISLRTRPLCAIVLWLLCRAEVRARDLAFRIGGGAALAFPLTASPLGWPGGTGEAGRLAERFRALAAGFFALSRQAARVLRPARRNGCVSLLSDFQAMIRNGLCSGRRHGSCFDTS